VYFAGFTINILTLMALALTVGILVNNAIVVLENIINKVDEGMPPEEAARRGTSEVAVAVTGATLTNVVVFVPIGFMAGIVGMFFKSFGLTAAFATIISLIVSFTLTPMLAARLISRRTREISSSGWFSRWFDKRYKVLENEYRDDLRWVIHHPLIVVVVCMALLGASFTLAPYLGFEFMAESDEGELQIRLRKPAGASLEASTRLCRKVEKICQAVTPEIKRIATKVGKVDALIGASEGVELAQVTLYLGNKSRRTRGVREILESLRADLAVLRDVSVAIEVPGAIGSAGPPLQVEVMGADLDDVVAFSKLVQGVVGKTEGAVDVDTTWLAGRPEVMIEPDRIRLERSGLSIAALAGAIRGRYAGLTPVSYREGSEEFDVRLQLQRDQRCSVDAVSEIEVVTASGDAVSIRDLASIRSSVGPSRIVRKERKKAVVVSGYVKGRSYGDVLSEIQVAIAALPNDKSVEVRCMGDAERMKDSFGELGNAFVLAVILTYMLLAALLESFIYPILILASLPVAFVGIFPALFVCGMRIAMFPLMAVVMLVGIVVNNGILIIENVTAYREQGDDLVDAVIKGASGRLRPIIMTTTAAALAMLPLALGQGAAGEMRAPMAVVSIGGLLASAALCIYLIPMLYFLWEKRQASRRKSSAMRTLSVVLFLVVSLFLGGEVAAQHSEAAGPVAQHSEAVGVDVIPSLSNILSSLATAPGPHVQTVDELVGLALRENRLVRRARRGVRVAHYDVAAARAAAYGEIKANVSRIRYNDTFKAFSEKDEATTKGLFWDVPLFTGGAIESGKRAAELGYDISRFVREQTLQDVAFHVIQAYLALVEGQWLVVLGQEHVSQMELQLGVADARLEAGAAVASERLRMLVALEEARVRLLQFENARARAEAGLNTVLNRKMDVPVQAVEPQHLLRLNEAVVSAYLRAKQKRPELLIANAMVGVKRAELKIARAEFMPVVGFNVTYGDASPMFASDDPSTQMLVSADVPLFKGGGMRARFRKAREQYLQEIEQRDFVERAVMLEIKQAFFDVQEASKRITVVIRAVESAAEHARITSERYKSGAVIVIELVDAQLTLLVSRTRVLKAIVDYAMAQMTYYKASGDLWLYFGDKANERPCER